MNERDDAPLADALVAATAAVGRYESRRRTAGRILLAASLLVAAVLGLRPKARPAVYVIHGDSTGVALTGPGVARRVEAPPPLGPGKGDRT
jgi:hypothetical protein